MNCNQKKIPLVFLQDVTGFMVGSKSEHGGIIKDGAKISKSKGNGVPLIRMRDTYGVDMYRLYITLAANYDVEMDFRDEDIYQLEKKFNKFKEVISDSLSTKLKKYEDFNDLQKWLVSRFYSKAKEYFLMFDEMRIREAYVSILYEFLNDINYFERRSDKKSLNEVIRFISKDYILLMTPATSHICEEFWSLLKEKNYVSLSSFETNCEDFIKTELEDKESIIENIISSVYRFKESKNIKNLSKVSIVQASDIRFKLFDAINENLKKTKNIKEIFTNLNKDFSSESKFYMKFVPKTFKEGLSYYMNKKDEKLFLDNLVDFFKNEFSCDVIVISNDDLETQVNALPGELGIILE
jgi:leucyl-tRNA synthetase